MADPALTPLEPDPVQAAILAELRAIRGLLEVFAAPRKTEPNGNHGRLLQAIAAVLMGGDGDLDVPFACEDVFAWARASYELDQALKACGVETTADLGVLFRSLRDRTIDGLRLERDGRRWRLVSCT